MILVQKTLLNKLLLLFIVHLTFNNDIFSQNGIHPLSFQANQDNYNDSYGEYYYQIKKEENKYRLTDKKGQDIFQETYDTITKNQYFIKVSKKDTVSIYRTKNLEKIELLNLKQAYFKQNGLEVLTNDGAQYYDNSISKIDNFPKIEFLKCGTVYSQQYTLKYSEETNKYSIELSEGFLGGFREETILEFKGIPDNVESVSFLNSKKYISESINSQYNARPNLVKIVKDGKSGIYSYNIDEAIYPVKEKKKAEVKKKYAYDIDEETGDTIFIVVPETPIEIEPISFIKKGSVKLQKILPIDYNQIQQNTYNGLIYLYKDKKIGIYPKHITTSFDFFKEKTTSFYVVSKNGKQGWIDIKTFKEFYF